VDGSQRKSNHRPCTRPFESLPDSLRFWKTRIEETETRLLHGLRKRCAAQDWPGDAEVRLDRALTYHNGLVGTDVQGLAIGNFDRSMHRYGLDRQFRGEIRNVQIFGSHLSGQGALPLGTIQKQLQ